jgi:hypothetical protein
MLSVAVLASRYSISSAAAPDPRLPATAGSSRGLGKPRRARPGALGAEPALARPDHGPRGKGVCPWRPPPACSRWSSTRLFRGSMFKVLRWPSAGGARTFVPGGDVPQRSSCTRGAELRAAGAERSRRAMGPVACPGRRGSQSHRRRNVLASAALQNPSLPPAVKNRCCFRLIAWSARSITRPRRRPARAVGAGAQCAELLGTAFGRAHPSGSASQRPRNFVWR